MIKKKQIIEQISTLNIIIFFVGFDFVTSFASLFIADIDEHSQLITIPFRAFALVISLLVLIINLKNKIKPNFSLICLFFYLFLLTIRLFYDFGIRNDIDTFRSDRMQVILLFGSMFINTLAVAKSYTNINLNVTFKYIYIFYAVILLINYLTVQEFSIESILIQKQVGTGVRNTIATGYIAAIFILISFHYYLKTSTSNLYKIIFIPIIFIATIILLRAGSRGPLLSVFIGIILYFSFKRKNSFKIIMYSFLSLSLLTFFYSEILSAIFKISPVMAERIEYTFLEGDKSRIEYFNAGIEGFLNNPFTGSYAFVYTPFEWYEYPHQLVIEAFMATGIFGGIALIVVLVGVAKHSIISIQKNSGNVWLALIVVTYIVRALSAGSIYFGEYPIVFTFILLTQYPKADL